MEQCVNRKKFFIFLTFILIFTGVQVSYLILHPTNKKVLNNFLHVSTLSSPSIYINTPFLRYRDLNNEDRIFTFHPALKESKIGTFIQKAPVK